MKFLALCLLGAASAHGQPAATDFVPPRSRVVLGINLRHILDSPLFPQLASDSRMPIAWMLAQNPLSHMDPLKDIDSVVIASTGEGNTPPTLAIVRGRFGRLKSADGARYHGVALVDDKNPKGVLALLDDSTLLAGDADEVHAAIDSRGKVTALPATLAARVAALAAKFDVWGTGSQAGGFAAAKGQTGGLDAVDRFEFGVAIRQGLALNAEVHVRSPQDAKKMTDALKFFQPMLKSDQFSLLAQGSTLKLSLAIPEEELKKAIAAAAARPQAKPQPKPDPRGKIVTNAAGDTVSVTLPGK